MPTETRDRRFNMILSEREHEMLTDLAGSRGLSASDFLRQTLRQMHREEFGAEAKSAKPTKGKK